MLLHRNSEACYPKASNDAELANAFADFFVQKIERLRGEITLGLSANGMTATTTVVNFLSSSCVSEFKFFGKKKTLPFNEVTGLIKSRSVKSCLLDPLTA